MKWNNERAQKHRYYHVVSLFASPGAYWKAAVDSLIFQAYVFLCHCICHVPIAATFAERMYDVCTVLRSVK